MRYFAILFIFVSVLLCKSGEKIITLNEPLGDVTKMKVNVEFSMGQLLLENGQDELAVTGYMKYHERFADATLTYQEYSGTGILELETDVDLDWHGYSDSDDEKSNDCELYLNPTVPIDLNLDFGFGESRLNLGSLQISKLIIDSGLGETTIDFGDTRNPIECEYIDVDTGLGSSILLNLGNSNAESMEFECGLGSMELDFTGELLHDIEINIAVGLGSITIWIPEGTNTFFDYDGSFLADIDLVNFQIIAEDEYRSVDYNPELPTLHFSASVGAGNIEINWKK